MLLVGKGNPDTNITLCGCFPVCPLLMVCRGAGMTVITEELPGLTVGEATGAV